MKRITAFALSLIFILSGMVSCKEEKSDDEKNKEMNALTNFPLKISEKVEINEKFDTSNLPKTGCTKYTLEFSRNIFELLLYSEEGRAVTSHINYPRNSSSTKELESGLKDGSIDIAYIEMTEADKTFDEELEYTLIGLFPMVFITSSENPVSTIPSDKLDDLFINGKISNWADLGGKNGEIQFIYNKDGYNTYNTLNRVLYQSDELKLNLKDVYDLYPDDYSIDIGETRPYYFCYEYNAGDKYTLTVENPYRLLGNMCATWGFDNSFKPVYIDGIKPTYESVKNGEYPYTLYTYAVTRKGEESENIGYLLDWIVQERIESSYSVNSTTAKESIGFNRLTMDYIGATRDEIVRLLNHYKPGADTEAAVIPYDETKYNTYKEWLSLVE